ncbi:MAG TPA: hypothetical protein VFC19_25630 [Candidatus Limnocylindrales bacterium]|nr:hypothetical protein [Candidatus Limnocylindrales bacterium]
MTPPAGRHRNLGPLQRFLKRAGSFILVLAALGVGDFVVRSTPDVDKRERPFVVSGEEGKAVEARMFSATLLKTRTAAVVKASGFVHDTQGVWVILRMRFVALHEPLSISYAAVVDARGRSFYASDRVNQSLVDGSRILQPGIGVEGDIAFEIPRDATGLTAQFSDARLNRAMQAVTGITISIDDGIFLNRQPVTLDPIEVKP